MLSVSRARCYEQCSLKYHAEYEEGLRNTGDFLDIGTVLHAVFERVDKEFGGKVDKETAFNLYDEEFTNHPRLTAKEHYQEGRGILDAFVDNEENFVFEVVTLPDGRRASELEFFIDLEVPGKYYVTYDEATEATENGAKILRGYIDKIVKLDDSSVMIVDYKTGWVMKSQIELDDDIQLDGYNLAVRTLMPDVENVFVSLNFVRHEKPVFSHRTAQDAEIHRRWFLNIFNKIRADEDPQPKLNDYCWTCAKRYDCPAYMDILSYPFQAPDFDEKDDRQRLWEIRQRMKATEKSAKKEKEQIDNMFRSGFEKTRGNAIYLDETELYQSPNSNGYYSFEDVLALAPIDALKKKAKITIKDAEEIVKQESGVEALRVLQDKKRVSYFQPTIKERKRK